MPPQFLFDISRIDLNHVVHDRESIRKFNPQRGDMEMLHAIVHVDFVAGQMIGYKDIAADEFWVDGHIPGRPLFPGVLMIECGAQMASFYFRSDMQNLGFVGFGGVDDCKFRQPVLPGSRLYLLCQKVSTRHGRLCCKVQGVVNSSIVFEAAITGIQM